MTDISEEDFGELKSDIKYIIKTVDETSKTLKEDRDTNRIDHGKLHEKINTNSKDLVKVKTIMAMFQVVWAGLMTWLWKAR